MYDGPIIDAHMHLWDFAMGRHPWLTNSTALAGVEKLRRDFLVDDFLSACAPHRVVASVYIEAVWDASDPEGELAWLDTLDRSSGVASRVVAGAPFGTDAAAAIIERNARHGRVAGFRAVLSHHPTLPAKSWTANGALAFDPAWRRDVAMLARMGKSLDLMMYPYQAEGVSDLARSLPDLCIIVNHAGGAIDRDAEGLARWRAALRLLAQAPNISIKVNKVGYDPNPDRASLRDTLLACLDAFGAERVVLATDWPVSTRYAGCAEIWDDFKAITDELQPAEQSALFHDNAGRLYGF